MVPGARFWVFLALLSVLSGCGQSSVEVRTPIQGKITVGSERDAQKASRALLNKIDQSAREIENIEELLKRAVGPAKRAEREALLKQKSDLSEGIRKELAEFLAFFPKVEAQGWKLQPFDEARYFYYSNRYKDLMPTTAPS